MTPCTNCGAPADLRCERCGRIVCLGCFMVDTDLCVSCDVAMEGKEE